MKRDIFKMLGFRPKPQPVKAEAEPTKESKPKKRGTK